MLPKSCYKHDLILRNDYKINKVLNLLCMNATKQDHWSKIQIN
jgi:hypothetical protein